MKITVYRFVVGNLVHLLIYTECLRNFRTKFVKGKVIFPYSSADASKIAREKFAKYI